MERWRGERSGKRKRKKEGEREVRRKNGVKKRKKKGREGLMDPENSETALSVSVCIESNDH